MAGIGDQGCCPWLSRRPLWGREKLTISQPDMGVHPTAYLAVLCRVIQEFGLTGLAHSDKIQVVDSGRP